MNPKVVFYIKRKGCNGFNFAFIMITTVLIVITINIILFANINTYSALPTVNSDNVMTYPELKEYERELKEDIKQFKEERANKVDYLASLDKKLAELESQYNKLLEESKRISDKLDSINTGKDY